MGSEQMGSEDRAASPMRRRCGSMWSLICFAPTPTLHRRYIADTSTMHRRCGGIIRPHLRGPHLGGLYGWNPFRIELSFRIVRPLKVCSPNRGPWSPQSATALSVLSSPQPPSPQSLDPQSH
eukprot:7324967-Pyramimonas_sp.AAC.1